MIKVQANRVHVLTGHTDCVYALEQADLPSKFFSAGGDGMVVAWDLRSPEKGQLLARLPQSVYALHYLKEECLLVCGHNHFGIRVLDVAKQKEVAAIPLSDKAIFDICSHGNSIFVADGHGMVWVIDRQSWTIKDRWIHADKSARSLALNPVNEELAVGYSDWQVRILATDNGSIKQVLKGHQNSVFTVAYGPGYHQLFTGSRDARLRIWNVDLGYAEKEMIVAHLYAINDQAFSPDGKHFVTCSLDKSIKVWQTAELKLLKVIDKARHAGHGTSVNKLQWTSFDNMLVSAGDDRTVCVWKIDF